MSLRRSYSTKETVPLQPMSWCQAVGRVRGSGALTAGLVPELLHTAPAPHEWSAVDVLAHLRACADVWGNCIAEIIAHDHPTTPLTFAASLHLRTYVLYYTARYR